MKIELELNETQSKALEDLTQEAQKQHTSLNCNIVAKS